MRRLAAIKLMTENPFVDLTKNPKLVSEILKYNFK